MPQPAVSLAMNWAKKRVNAIRMNKIRVMAVGPVPVATSAVGQEETLAAEAEEILAVEVPVATSAAEGTPVGVEAAAISNIELPPPRPEVGRGQAQRRERKWSGRPPGPSFLYARAACQARI